MQRKSVQTIQVAKIENGYTVYYYIRRETPYFSENKTVFCATFEEVVSLIQKLEAECIEEFLALEAPLKKQEEKGWDKVETDSSEVPL